MLVDEDDGAAEALNGRRERAARASAHLVEHRRHHLALRAVWRHGTDVTRQSFRYAQYNSVSAWNKIAVCALIQYFERYRYVQNQRTGKYLKYVVERAFLVNGDAVTVRQVEQMVKLQ